MNNFMIPFSREELTTDNIEAVYTRALTKNTKRAYVANILSFFNVVNLKDITKGMVNAVTVDTANTFCRWEQEKGLTNGTINIKLSALHNFYGFLCRKDIQWATYNPFSTSEGCIRMKNNKPFVTTYCASINDTKSMLSECNTSTIKGTRDKLMLTLLAISGIRREEVTNIQIKDILSHDGKYVVLIHGKGGKDRYCILSVTAIDLMTQYMEARKITFKNGEEYLFINHSHNFENSKISTTSINRIIKSYAEKTGTISDKLSTHSMRRFFATESLKMNISIYDLSLLMGHSSPETTKLYDYRNKIEATSKANEIDNLLK